MLTVAAVRDHIEQLCKPPGSLGQLEDLAVSLCVIQQTLKPRTRPRRVTIFAADHGVASDRVTAWPREITGQVVSVMQAGRSASAVMAKTIEADYEVVDVGVLKPLPKQHAPLLDCAGRRGTGNLLIESAMSGADFDHAWKVGCTRADDAADGGMQVVIGGEMGIGNTTAASTLACLLADLPVGEAVGRGAGIKKSLLEQKRQVVDAAVRRVTAVLKHADAKATVPKRVATEAGGLEIVALSGFFAQAAKRGLTVVLDGFICTVAALLAERLQPGTRDNMIAGHRSCEPGHRAVLRELHLEPVLDMGFRLGEATGAIVACPVLDLAATMVSEMASLHELSQLE